MASSQQEQLVRLLTNQVKPKRDFNCNINIDEFIRGFQIFDKDGKGTIGLGELRYILTNIGEKFTDEEFEEFQKLVQVGP